MTEAKYQFTRSQLDALLSSALDLFTEYATRHRPDDMDDFEVSTFAHASAVRDTLEGLDAEVELIAHGEPLRPTFTRIPAENSETVQDLRDLRNRLQDHLRTVDPEGAYYLVLTEASDQIHVDIMDTTLDTETIDTVIAKRTLAELLAEEDDIRKLISAHVADGIAAENDQYHQIPAAFMVVYPGELTV